MFIFSLLLSPHTTNEDLQVNANEIMVQYMYYFARSITLKTKGEPNYSNHFQKPTAKHKTQPHVTDVNKIVCS